MTKTVHPWGPFDTPYIALGGEERIRSIVEDFYDIIDQDAPVLRAMLPSDDSVSRQKLFEYLVEWTGGAELYSANRGHPRLRMRHLPFVIGEEEVDTWLECMSESFDANGVVGDIRAFLDDRVRSLAHHMRNT